MGLEAATFIGQLSPSNPAGTDSRGQGDDHLRLVKQVLQSTFPNLNFAVTFSSFAVTYLDENSADSVATTLGVPTLAGNNTLTGTLQLNFSDDGAGPQYRFDLRSASATPATDDDLIETRIIGVNDAASPEDVVYASFGGTIKDKTDGSEDGEFYVKTAVAGAIAKRVKVGAGLYSTNATDGDKGADTANFKHYYKDGIELGTGGYLSEAASYSATASDAGATIEFTSSATLNLPAAADNRGAKFNVVSASSSVTVTVDPAGAETLDGLASRKVTNCRVTIVSDGVGWKTCEGMYFYDSGDQTVSAGADLTLAHNLGVLPDFLTVRLKCSDAGGDAGYAQNDVVEAYTVSNSGSQHVQPRVDATNIVLNQSSAIYVLNKSTHGFAAITTTKWQWNVTAAAR